LSGISRVGWRKARFLHEQSRRDLLLHQGQSEDVQPRRDSRAAVGELEHRLRCERVPSVANGKYGKTVFNPNGKNPGDVWGDIKQLTYKSKDWSAANY